MIGLSNKHSCSSYIKTIVCPLSDKQYFDNHIVNDNLSFYGKHRLINATGRLNSIYNNKSLLHIYQIKIKRLFLLLVK